ncbi:uncharacterized protein LOC129315651 isoform X2 [Prosopis cineraria]|uniref:uncharacterized protein LOC129315651 isoform X2 n=1 Tax=Prosopis cineraria TaxID=364024 RepID=UPI00240FF49E|nr:uncharacterized protein LOC129315651 isoform X2 [Prosopis cineraria]
MQNQLHTSLSSSEVLLRLPQPSLALSLFSNPSADAGCTTDSSLDSVSNVQNLIVNEVRPMRYGPVDLTSNSGIGPEKIKVAQPVQCEICMINCNSNDVYIKHLSGKKHLRKLEKLSKLKNDGVAGVTTAITTNDLQLASNPAFEKLDANKQERMNSYHQPENAVILGAPEKDIETRKRKNELEGGTSLTSTMFCTLSNVNNNEKVFNLPDFPAQCKICMINCNSEHVYISHVSGKKHMRNLEKLSKSKNVGADASGASVVAASVVAARLDSATEPLEKLDSSKQESINLHQPGIAFILDSPEKDIETKKQKIELEGGGAGTFSCNQINVSSLEILNLPDCPVRCEIWKKHLRNLEKLSKSKNVGADASIAGAVAATLDPATEPLEKSDYSKRESINLHQPGIAFILEAPEKYTETEKQKIEFEGGAGTFSCNQFHVNSQEVLNLPDCPIRCEVCLIDCNSKHVYIGHLSGKKHKRNLQNVSKSKDVADVMPAIDMQQETNPAIEPQGKLETNPQEGMDSHKSGNIVVEFEAPDNDIETKKHGSELIDAAAATNFFKVCNLCNAPCNSQTVFNSHLQGKRHAAKVKKELAKSNTSWWF